MVGSFRSKNLAESSSMANLGKQVVRKKGGASSDSEKNKDPEHPRAVKDYQLDIQPWAMVKNRTSQLMPAHRTAQSVSMEGGWLLSQIRMLY